MPKKKGNEQEEKKQESIQYTSEKRRLFHKFTDADVNVLNEKVTELTRKKDKFAEEAKLHASIAKGADCEIKKTVQALDEGGEEREMECPVVINYDKGTYTVKHPETGDLVEERKLTADERQQPLFPDAEKGAEEALDEAVGGTTVE